MVVIKKYFYWQDGREATLGGTLITLVGCFIQFCMGYISATELADVIKVNPQTELPLGILEGTVVLMSLDACLLTLSICLFIAAYKDSKARWIYVPWCIILTVRISYEAGFGLHIYLWFISYHILSVGLILKAIIYFVRSFIWIYCLLCVISRYQELKAEQIKDADAAAADDDVIVVVDDDVPCILKERQCDEYDDKDLCHIETIPDVIMKSSKVETV